MATERHRRLVRFVQQRAGEHFRAAIRYDADDWEVLDVEQGEISELMQALPTLHERLKRRKAIVEEHDYRPLGEAKATAEIHEDGLLMHFPESKRSGVLVTLDESAGRKLSEFAEQCQVILEPVETSRFARAAQPTD